MRQYQPSNVARELKQKLEVVRGGEAGSNDTVLGQEPQGGISKEPDVKPSTASRLHFSCFTDQFLLFERYPANRFPFLQRVTNSLERRPKPKTEAKSYYGNRNNDSYFHKEKPPTPEPYYEEIAVMKKRKKKEPPSTPTPCTKDLYEEVETFVNVNPYRLELLADPP